MAAAVDARDRAPGRTAPVDLLGEWFQLTLLRNPGSNQQFQSFAGYSGTVLADTVVHRLLG